MADPRGKPTPYDHHFVPHVEFKGQNGWLRKARLAARAIYSREARHRIRAMIEEFRPDVAHVRNIYHHLSPSILWELRAQKVPVVYHLNDFKLLCPSYNLVSQGEVCEACKNGTFWRVLRSRCYPGLGARMTLAAEAYVHKWMGTYGKCVDRFLAPSQFVRDKFVEHGWDAAKFEVLPHFQRMSAAKEPAPEDSPLLYFGRLSREKGVDDLLRAMQRMPGMRLVIAGDGPERERLEQLAIELGLANVEFLGQLSGAELDRAISESLFTVLPSHAYETLGKTILESYARARAVVASDMGSRRELVLEGETGLLYPTGDVERLAKAIEFLGSRRDLSNKMGRAGWERAQRGYRPEAHYEALLGLYESLVAEKQAVAGRVRRDREGRVRVAFIGGRGVISKYSGIETYYEEVGQQLAKKGHEVTAYCRSYFTPAIKNYKGIRLVRLPTIRSKHLETVMHTLLSTMHAVTQGYDVVHYHALGPALFSCVPRMFGKKTLVTVQGLDWQRKKWGRVASTVLRLGERAAVQLPSGTMVVSQVLQQFYRERYGVETFYVPNGGVVRERKVVGRISDWGLRAGQYILFLGRFSPEKCCHLLVDAYERLDTEVRLVMAGASSYCDDYSRRLREHASDRIKMLDWVSGETLDELLTNAMMFVLPSDMEGLSLALLDAMGAGLCVLTSDVPENREVVEGAGYVFRRGDVASLEERLGFLIANPEARHAAGRAAKRRIAGQYVWPKIAADIERAYFRVLGWEELERPLRKPVGHLQHALAVEERRAG